MSGSWNLLYSLQTSHIPQVQCGINHRRQWSTLEQDNDAPQMPICLMNLIEPKRRWADPSEAKLYVCSIPNIKIYLVVVDQSWTCKLVSFIPYNLNLELNWSQQSRPPSLVLMALASNNVREEKNTHILIMKVSVWLSCVDWGHKIKMIHFTDRLYPLWLKKQ